MITMGTKVRMVADTPSLGGSNESTPVRTLTCICGDVSIRPSVTVPTLSRS